MHLLRVCVDDLLPFRCTTKQEFPAAPVEQERRASMTQGRRTPRYDAPLACLCGRSAPFPMHRIKQEFPAAHVEQERRAKSMTQGRRTSSSTQPSLKFTAQLLKRRALLFLRGIPESRFGFGLSPTLNHRLRSVDGLRPRMTTRATATCLTHVRQFGSALTLEALASQFDACSTLELTCLRVTHVSTRFSNNSSS